MWRGVSAGQEVAIRVAGGGGAGEQGEEEPAPSQATLRARRQVNTTVQVLRHVGRVQPTQR